MALKKKTTAKKAAGKKAPVARKKGAAKKAAGKKAPAARKKSPARRKAALFPAEVALPAGPPENPRAHALARKIGHLLEDKKATDIVILDVRGMTSYADYFVVASGESDRQVSAMAEHVQVKLKEDEGMRAIGTEGTETGQWVLLDFGEVVAHLFFTETRSFYDLEGLWADAPREKVA